MVYIAFDKKARNTGAHTGAENYSEDQQLPNELYKLMTRKFQKRQEYLSCRDKTWDADLTIMQLMIGLSLWKTKMTLQSLMHVKKYHMNLLVNQARYGETKAATQWRSMKPLLRDNGSDIYSKPNEETSAVAERFIKTLKNKI